MTDGFLIGAAAACWLGILTSISPCPLATNITAVSYISRKITDRRYVILTGIFYTLGRSLAYFAVAGLVLWGIFAVPALSHFLQTYLNKLLGPVLVLAGMFLLELINIDFDSSGWLAGAQEKLASLGAFGALPLGVLFALAFCPVSAALFFGSLLPLSLKYNSAFGLPVIYGIGTALPVFAFSVMLSAGADKLSSLFKRVTTFEVYLRKATGLIFIGVGVYFSIQYIWRS